MLCFRGALEYFTGGQANEGRKSFYTKFTINDKAAINEYSIKNPLQKKSVLIQHYKKRIVRCFLNIYQ